MSTLLKIHEIFRTHDLQEVSGLGAYDLETALMYFQLTQELISPDGGIPTEKAVVAMMHDVFVGCFGEELAGAPGRYRAMAKEVHEAFLEGGVEFVKGATRN